MDSFRLQCRDHSYPHPRRARMSPVSRTKVAPPKRVSPWVKTLLFYGPILAITALVLVVTYAFFVEAPPPRKLIIATGSKEGAYYKFAKRYAKLLEKDGLTVEVLETK